MSAARQPILVAPVKGMNTVFVTRVLGSRAAARIATIIDTAQARALDHLTAATREAEAGARAQMAAAQREAEAMLEEARTEALAILRDLPDFDRLEATRGKAGGTALSAIRAVADRHGLAMAALTRRRNRNPAIHAAKAEAVVAVASACPHLSDAEIGVLFGGIGAGEVRKLRHMVVRREAGLTA